METFAPFSTTQAFRSAWNTLRNNVGIFVLFAVILFFIQSPMMIASQMWLKDAPSGITAEGRVKLFEYVGDSLLQIGGFGLYCTLFWIISMFLLTLFAMALHKGKEPSLSAFSFTITTLVRYCIARLVLMVKFIIGLIFFIIPGFYIALKNFYAGFSIIDDPSVTLSEDTSITHQLTYGVMLRLLGITFLQGFLTNILSQWANILSERAIVSVDFMSPLGRLTIMQIWMLVLFLNTLLSIFFVLMYVDIFYQLKEQRLT